MSVATPPYLTMSRRFVFAASSKLARGGWSAARNRAAYGPAARASIASGSNYVCYVVFHGPVDEVTGMLVNLSLVRERVHSVLDTRYDHRFLNLDTPPFDVLPPTVENVAHQLLGEIVPLFEDLDARPVACHVMDSPDSGATAFVDGRVERDFWMEFSAARRTFSPHLSEEENARRFGKAAGKHGHGHNYRLRATLAGRVDSASGVIVRHGVAGAAFAALHDELDHTNLNADVKGLKGVPITTECLARYAWQRLARTLPIGRVRLWELPWLSASYRADASFRLAVEKSFHAAHRLHAPALSAEANRALYGKCNNPNGHGHRYVVETAVGGTLDETSGTLADLVTVESGIDRALEPWRYAHLDEETGDFRARPSSGENILTVLWDRLEDRFGAGLERARLWETENNRFTLRRVPLVRGA